MQELFRRLVELVVGLVALAIAGLTIWMCVDTTVHPPDTGVPRYALWAIVYLLAFGAFALATFGLRLMIPRLRADGGRIIGLRGIGVFTFVYACVVIFGLMMGPSLTQWTVAPVMILAATAMHWRARVRARPPR